MMPTTESFDLSLFQPKRGLWIAPIRHHSPACAWAVRAMIREIQPDHVLIEGPSDLSPLIDGICDARSRPPVAAVVLRQGRAAYVPFCIHSPEYVAMLAAREVGAKLRFIDQHSDSLFTGEIPDTGQISLSDESPFDNGRYVKALCARTGCRDGFELWDYLFESRLGQGDWQGFLRDVGIYCAGLRASTSDGEMLRRGDIARETVMAGHIAGALKSGKVVAVVGGFHAPALIDPKGNAPKVPSMRDSFLLRYSHAAMDALAGYSAGLPQPGFYDALWQAAERADGMPNWRALAAELVQDFTNVMAGQGHPVSLPAKVEILRMAETLALMRGRSAVLRYDLFDGVQSALTKGEVSASEPWSERLRQHWHGTAFGEIPSGLSAAPLVEDARKRASMHRLDISDSLTKRRSLDIHRKPRHLAASRYLHAMVLLDSDFAQMVAGPDYVCGYGTDRLFEEWNYTWSPIVETRLIALAAQCNSDTVPGACVKQLWQLRERGLGKQMQLIGQAIRAGLGDQLTPFVKAFADDIVRSGGFAEIGQVLQRLYALCHTRGPMRAPDALNLPTLLKSGYERLIYLVDDLPHVPEDMATQAVRALRLIADLLASDENGSLDRQMFDEAMARLSAVHAPAEITGAALALALRAGQLLDAQLVAALRGDFLGVSLKAEKRMGVLCGMMATVPELLWQRPEIMAAVDDFISALDESEFLILLPTLRRVSTALNPGETDRLAQALARRHGAWADPLAASQFTESDLAMGVAAHNAMLEALQADGLLEEPNE